MGDLFYIQNLVAAIEAPGGLEKMADPRYAEQGDPVAYSLGFHGDGATLALTDTLPSGVSAPGSFGLVGTGTAPTYDPGTRQLTWSDAPPEGQRVTIAGFPIRWVGGDGSMVRLVAIVEE